MDIFEYVSTNILGFLKSVLPTSPFAEFIEELNTLPYLSYINWLIPIGDFITIGIVWLSVIGMYYLYSILMRWAKMIE